MLSCYGERPDEESVRLMAQELLRRHENEQKKKRLAAKDLKGETESAEKEEEEMEVVLHERATVKDFTQFLKRNAFNKEVAYAQWNEFIRWRECVGADNITTDDISRELSTNEAVWHGKDKEERPCLIVTGRLHTCDRTVGSGVTFQKFIIHLVEKGLKLADDAGKEEVCVLYDRRGLEFEHIDSMLSQNCQNVISMLQQWYSNRLGKIYILHLGTFYWILYTFFLWPFLGFFLGHGLIIMTDPKELLNHFNVEDLPPNFIESGMTRPGDSNASNALNETSKNEIDDNIEKKMGYADMIEQKKIERENAAAVANKQENEEA